MKVKICCYCKEKFLHGQGIYILKSGVYNKDYHDVTIPDQEDQLFHIRCLTESGKDN